MLPKVSINNTFQKGIDQLDISEQIGSCDGCITQQKSGGIQMNKLSIIISSIFLAACAAKPASPGAEKLYVSNQRPPKGCVFVGEVQGSQGNFWTAEFTSDRNILSGARNEMRNQALSLGANYVMVEIQSNSHNTARPSLGGTYASVIIGNAFACPGNLLGNI
jgi:hypothetical protein